MPHKDIRIPFTINQVEFEAVGFLNEGESLISGEEMLKRVDNIAQSEEDYQLIWGSIDKLPEELKKYYLVTNRRGLGFPQDLSCFDWGGERWYGSSVSVGFRWDGCGLVLQKVKSKSLILDTCQCERCPRCKKLLL